MMRWVFYYVTDQLLCIVYCPLQVWMGTKLSNGGMQKISTLAYEEVSSKWQRFKINYTYWQEKTYHRLRIILFYHQKPDFEKIDLKVWYPTLFCPYGLVVQTFHSYYSKGVYFLNFYSDWLYKAQKDKIQSHLFGNRTLWHSLSALLMRAILNLEIEHNGSM